MQIFASQVEQHFLMLEAEQHGCMPAWPGWQRSRTRTGLQGYLYNLPLHLQSRVGTLMCLLLLDIHAYS